MLIVEFYPERFGNPLLKFIYFTTDERTGAKKVLDIMSVSIPDDVGYSPSFIALHYIRWMEDFETVLFQYDDGAAMVGFFEVQRADITETHTAVRLCSYAFHMIWAHIGGYGDDNGMVVKGSGTNLFEAYKAAPGGDFGPYLSAGQETHVRLIKEG